MASSKGNNGRLRNITREVLAPVWARTDIRTADMAKALGVSRAGLSWHALHILKLPDRANIRRTVCNDTALFAEMWDAGVHTAQIADHFGYAHTSCVTHARKRLGLKPRPRGGMAAGAMMRGGYPIGISIDEFWAERAAKMLREAMLQSAQITAARMDAMRAEMRT